MESKIKKKGNTYKLTLKDISERELQLLWGMLNTDCSTIRKFVNKGFNAQPGWLYPKAKLEECDFYELWDTIEEVIPRGEEKDEQ